MSKRQKPVSWVMSHIEYTYPPELHAELVQRNLKAGLCAHGFAHEDDCPTCKRTPNQDEGAMSAEVKSEEHTCAKCAGTGKVEEAPCKRCRGIGKDVSLLITSPDMIISASANALIGGLKP